MFEPIDREVIPRIPLVSAGIAWVEFNRAPEFPVRLRKIEIVGEKRLRERGMRLA